MTFQEMRDQYDHYEAFNDFITVKRAKYIRVIPEGYEDIFPENCECGSDMIINYSATKVTCCNPRCHIKQALALSELFSRFNYKGIADANCTTIYQMLERKDRELKEQGEKGLFISDSFVEILLLDINVYPSYFTNSAVGLTFFNGIHYLREQSLTFPEMVGKLGLPEFDSTAYKLFEGISSFTELQNAIQNAGGIERFCNQHGVYASMKKFWLKASLPDIAVASFIFEQNIRLMGLKSLDICITGSLYYKGQRTTKNSFIKIANEESYSRKLIDIFRDVFADVTNDISSSDISQIEQLVGGSIRREQKDFYKVSDILEYLQESDLPAIQILEIRMTTAKKSAPFILADSPSNSDKYLEGKRRGVERSFDGELRKVLISSDEFIDVVHETVSKWEKELIDKCRAIITQSTERMSSF